MKYLGYTIRPDIHWRCTEEKCPAFDGKRCRPIGCRPDVFCEPRILLAQEKLKTQRRRIRNLLRIVRDASDPFPCKVDHNGNCQAHDWFDGGRCVNVRARKALEALESKYLKGKL